MTDNYIYRFPKMTEQEEPTEEFDLVPFEITTQAIERTLIDKIFALCDYYLSDKVDRHSRYLYDIYKIMEYTKLDTSLLGLVQEVRSLWESLPVLKQDYVSIMFWQRLWIRKYIGMITKQLLVNFYLHMFLTKRLLVG